MKQIGHASEQIPNLESIEMIKEVKKETFDDDSITSETFRIKTEFKAELKKEAFEELDAK